MFRLASYCAAMIVLTAQLGPVAHAQVSGANPKVIVWQQQTPNTDIFVGILGEVAKPGVYHLDPQSLTLQSVIRRAGGITSEASLTIRIIRQDRVIQSVFLSPQTDGALLPGDLLVVESRQTQSAVSRTYESDPQVRSRFGEEAPAQTARPGVQLAFLNVLDRPVVVKVRHEEANLLHLVQELAQSIELAQSVRVISPEKMLSQATAIPVQAPIPDGSVLVFPRNAINRNKLPILPAAYESGIAVGAFPSLIGGRSGQSPELRNVGQLPPLVARQSMDSMSAVPSPSGYDQTLSPGRPESSIAMPPAQPIERRTEAPPPPTQMPVVKSSPRIATIPFSGLPRVTSSSSTAQTGEPEPAPSDSPLRRLESSQRQPSLDQSETELNSHDSLDSTEAIGTPATPVSIPSLLLILATVGALIGIALATRRRLESQSAAQSPTKDTLRFDQPHVLDQPGIEEPEPALRSEELQAPIALPTSEPIIEHAITGPHFELNHPIQPKRSLASRLDLLIRNELKIRDERPEFPRQIVLQGRIVTPPVFRVDPPVSSPLAQGPHFNTKPVERPVQAQAIAQAPIKPREDLDGPHAGGPAKPHFMRRQAGENTVAAAASMASRPEVAPPTSEPRESREAKGPATPLADALRQLQGGQP